MKVGQLIDKTLNESAPLNKGERGVLVLDIDDTLLSSQHQLLASTK